MTPPAITWMQRLRSWFRPIVLETTQSPYNPRLEVVLSEGRLKLNATTANYSFGSLHALFQDLWIERDLGRLSLQNALLLGFGAGSVLRLIRAHHPQVSVVGIELDAEVIRLASKWFGLKNEPALSLFNADAFQWLATNCRRFDLVVADLFIDCDSPDGLSTPTAIRQLATATAPEGLCIVNRIVDTPARLEESLRFQQLLKQGFSRVEVYPVTNNHLLLCRAPRY